MRRKASCFSYWDVSRKIFLEKNDNACYNFRYFVIDEKIYLLSIYSKKDNVRILNDKQSELMIKNLAEESGNA